jgi:hypothetical protein
MKLTKHFHDYYEIIGWRPVLQAYCLSETIPALIQSVLKVALPGVYLSSETLFYFI